MRTILCTLFLCSAFLAHAQKNPKNEFSAGYFTTGYFFDSTDWVISNFIRGEAVNLNYLRRINKHLNLNFNHSYISFDYFPIPYDKPFPNNSVIARGFNFSNIALGYRFTKWGLGLTAKAGLSYRYRVFKLVHYGYNPYSAWVEPLGVYFGTSSLGATLGFSLSHPILWRFFGEFDCSYGRMFSKYKVDPNQLLLVYRLGFRF
jgi:hypothetical protein